MTQIQEEIREEEPSAEQESRPDVSLWTLFWTYLKVGVTAFGFSILPKVRRIVIENRWLNEEETNEGLALVQLYPGPVMPEFIAYVGYRLRGVPGAALAMSAFILPAYVLMLALSIGYFSAGSLPFVQPLFLGLEALVIGTIANVTLDFAAQSFKGKIEAALGLGAFVALLLSVNPLLVVLAALVLGGVLLRPPPSPGAAVPYTVTPLSARRLAAIALAILIVLAIVAFSYSLHSAVGDLALALFRIGAVAFGNGATIIPLIQHEVVQVQGLLTPSQFAAGVALGQVTPGPFLITATFIGYKVGGIGGATLATFAIFAAPFLWALIFSEIYARLPDLRAIRGALEGVLAAFVGLLAVVVLQLSAVAIVSPISIAFAAGALVAMRYFKLDVAWIFLGGLALWALLLVLGVV